MKLELLVIIHTPYHMMEAGKIGSRYVKPKVII